MCAPLSSGFFPLKTRQKLWKTVQPAQYPHRIDPFALIAELMMAYVFRLSGLRELVKRRGRSLGTGNFSSLSHAIRRTSSLLLTEALCKGLEFAGAPRRNALIAIDSMAITMPKTQRHRCKKFNNQTVGGGVLWAFLLDAVRGVSPVRILKTMRGAWHDAFEMKDVELIANGPIYLMDRGFFQFALIERLLREKVHFILRIRKSDVNHLRVIREISPARLLGNISLTLDALVELGCPKAKLHPRVRLLMTTLSNGEDLYLVTDRLDLSAQTLLAMYKRRWEIEGFHRLVKDVLGFAHLYSFDQQGIEFLLRVALLLTLLLYLAAVNPAGKTLDLLRTVIRQIRSALGLTGIWRRNSSIRPRNPKKRGRKTKNL